MAAANFPTSPSNNDTHTVGSAEYTFDSTKGVWNNTTSPIISYSVQDGELSQNNFTTTLKDKLDGVEASATADQTDAEIKTAVEAGTSFVLGGSPTTTTQTAGDNSTKIATTAYADTAASPKLNTSAFTTTADTWAGVLATSLVPVVPTGETVSVHDLGSSTHKWRDIYMSGDTLNIGTQTVKATASGIQLPELQIGTGTNKVKLAVATDGSMATTSTDSSGTTSATVKSLTAGSYTEIRDAVEAATDSNTFTDADHTKLDGIETAATADQTAAQILTAVKTVDGTTSGLDADLLDGQEGSYYTGYTDTAVSNLVDSSPAALNTLNELAAALGDDANYATTTASSIGTKLPKTGGAMTGAITTNSTFDGRDVSTDGAKLDGIAASANNYTHPSVNHVPAGGSSGQVLSYASSGTAQWGTLPSSYSLPTSSSSTLGGVKVGTNLSISGTGVLSSTDTNTTYSVQDGGLSQNNFTNADHSKLDGIAASANNYVHPALSHVPSGGSAGQVLTYSSGGTAQWGTQTSAYTLPTSSSSTLGGVKVGTNLSIDGSGVLSATDTNTTYSVQDGQLSQKNFTTTLKTKLDGVATSANNFTYTHPTGAGNNHVPTGGSTGQFLKYSASGVAVWAADNDTDTVYTHPTGSGNNHIPANGSTGQFLKYDSAGTAVWAADNNTDTVYTHPTTAGNKHVPAGGASGQVLSYASDGTAQWVSAFSAGASYATFVSKTSVSTAVSAVDITNLDADAHYLFRGWFIFATDNNMSFSFYDGASINTAQAIYYQQNKMSGLTTDYSASSSTQSATNKNYDTYIGGHFSRGLTFDGSILTKSGTAKMVLQTQGRTTPDIVSTYTLGQGTAGAGQHFITAGYNATNIAKSIRGLRLKAWSGNISSGELLLFKVNEA